MMVVSRLLRCLLLVLVLDVSSAFAQTPPCPCDKNRDVLIAFHAATNGNDWTTVKWNTASSVCTHGAWQGIVCSNSTGDITAISIIENNLVGTLPEVLANLTQLEQLLLQENKLYGTLPPSFASFNGSLRKFDVQDNQLSGSIPAAYASWVNIDSFDCRTNRLNGTLPPELASWTLLNSFEAADNNLEGTLPPEYGAWVRLTNLDLSFNNLTGSLPASYSALKSMRDFAVSNNSLSGTLPPGYSEWRNVHFFDVDFNKLTGTLPWEYRNWTEIDRVSMHANALTGTLPPDYGDGWPKAKSLSFPRNRISGTLPASWSKMEDMQLLSFSGNLLNGTLPPDYASFTKIAMLSLDFNQFSGTLPPRWGSLRLFTLLLQENHDLVGTFPSEWSQMFVVPNAFFSVCDTQLCGTAAQVGLVALGCLPPDAVGIDNLTVIVSRATFAFSKSCVDTAAPTTAPTPPPPNVTRPAANAPSPLTSAASRAAQGVLAWGALLGSTLPLPMPAAAVASLQAGMGALRLRRRCIEADDRQTSTDGASAAVASEPTDNPTLLSIDALGDALRYAGGAVLANAMLILSFGCLLHLGSLLKARIEGKDQLDPQSSGRCARFVQWVGHTLSSDRLPVSLLTPFAILLQPSIASSVVLVAHTDAASAGSIALGVFGLALYCTPLMHTAWTFQKRLSPFPLQYEDRGAAPPPRRPRTVKSDKVPQLGAVDAAKERLRRQVVWWMEPTEAWRRNDATGEDRIDDVYCRRYEAVYRPYRGGWHAFLIVELGMVAIGGVVLGAALSVDDASACAAAIWGSASLAVLSGVLLVLHGAVRPFTVRFDTLTSVAIDVLVVAAEVAALAGAVQATESLVVAASCLELAVLVVCAALGIAHGRSPWQPHRRHAAPAIGMPPVLTTQPPNAVDDETPQQEHRRRQRGTERATHPIASSTPRGRQQLQQGTPPTSSQLRSLHSLIALACTKDYLQPHEK